MSVPSAIEIRSDDADKDGVLGACCFIRGRDHILSAARLLRTRSSESLKEVGQAKQTENIQGGRGTDFFFFFFPLHFHSFREPHQGRPLLGLWSSLLSFCSQCSTPNRQGGRGYQMTTGIVNRATGHAGILQSCSLPVLSCPIVQVHERRIPLFDF